jgi:RND superfamily putative drug exporter
VITSAGIILSGTFGALMILPLRDLFQLGLAVAIGVLLDTFVVRTVMVPGIVLLLGKWNWWPSQRSRERDQQISARTV